MKFFIAIHLASLPLYDIYPACLNVEVMTHEEIKTWSLPMRSLGLL